MVTSPHAALASFQVLQEVAGHYGRRNYLARSKSGTLVTIRELGDNLDADQITRLSKEVSLGAGLSSDAFLQTRSLLLDEGYAALVSEFVPGVSLQRLLRFATGRGVRLPDVCAWYVLERVLTALASAHAVKDGAGNPSPVIHRQVVPANVVIGWDGTVKLADFGLFRMWQIAWERQEFSGPHQQERTMSPEEAVGRPADTRSDVHNAALLAVRLATGRTPYARFRESIPDLISAIMAGNVARVAKTRPDLAEPLRQAIDAALETDREKRLITAEELLGVVRANADIAAGKAALAKLLGRWRQPLEATVTPWQARASISDDVPDDATGLVKENTLTLVTRDEEPSDPAIIAGVARDSVPREEAALAPTDPVVSLSRLGSIAPDALVMPLPAMRITMPSLPTYGGPAINIPRPPPKQGIFTGKVAAAVVATMFVVLLAGTVILFRWLTHQ